MSRPIKFRAWDGKQVLADVVPWGDNTIIDAGEYEHSITGVVAIMQFTGLTDKNGTEIYEGDILDGYCSQGRVKLGAIEWQQNKLRFYAPPRKANNDHDLFERMGSYEVIGNIWENGDLLT